MLYPAELRGRKRILYSNYAKIPSVDKIIEEILSLIRAGKTIDADKLNSIIRAHNKGETDNSKHYAKKYLLPYYLEQKDSDSQIFQN